jgi:hypothetical protein
VHAGAERAVTEFEAKTHAPFRTPVVDKRMVGAVQQGRPGKDSRRRQLWRARSMPSHWSAGIELTLLRERVVRPACPQIAGSHSAEQQEG